MLTPKLGGDGQVVIDISIADLDIRFESKDNDTFFIECVDTSGFPGFPDIEVEKISQEIPAKQVPQILALIAGASDEDASLYDGLEEIFSSYPQNLRPIP